MNSTAEKAKTRGHWTIRIRPESYGIARALGLADLEKAVRESAVSLRGWDFPHFDYKVAPTRSLEYVEQATDWEHYVEMWRAYKSGQFISVGALWCDWVDQSSRQAACQESRPGQTVGVEDAVFRLVEIYEFAARWARALEISDKLIVDCTISGLAGRYLELNPRRGFRIGGTCQVPQWSHSTVVAPATLFAQARELAVPPATSLFEIFGWDARPEVIKGIQSELRG